MSSWFSMFSFVGASESEMAVHEFGGLVRGHTVGREELNAAKEQSVARFHGTRSEKENLKWAIRGRYIQHGYEARLYWSRPTREQTTCNPGWLDSQFTDCC